MRDNSFVMVVLILALLYILSPIDLMRRLSEVVNGDNGEFFYQWGSDEP